MKKFNKTAIVIFSSLALVFGVAVSNNSDKVVSVHANYQEFETVEALDTIAEAIVLGVPVDDFKDRDHQLTTFDDGTVQSFHTLADIEIKEVIKSTDNDISENQNLTIVEPVSMNGETMFTYSDYTPLEQGKEYIIFLVKNSYGDYGIINMEEGKFTYDSEDIATFSEENDNSLKAEVYNKYFANKE